MKATGIVRRIDELGRVVVPKEIRRTLRIREGDPLEIFIEGTDTLIFKKYSILSDIEDYAKKASDSLISYNINCAIFDSNHEFISGFKSFSDYNIESMKRSSSVEVLDEESGISYTSILSKGEIIGYIVFDNNNTINAEIVKPVARMLGHLTEY